jgi:hypothetical protein
VATTYELIASTTLGSNAASVTFGSGGTIPQTYTDLVLLCSVRGTYSGGGEAIIRCAPNNAAPTRSNRYLTATGTSVSSNATTGAIWLGTMTNDGATASTFSNVETYIPNYAGSTHKSISSTSVSERNSATGNQMFIIASLWSSTDAITSLVLEPETGNFKSGSSFFLYAITKS